ncbi:MAG: site-specific integrase [Chitinophagales bacterium]
MSTLRNQMIQQLELKGYSPKTIDTYIGNLVQLANYYHTSPDLLSIQQIRDYLHYMIVEKKRCKSWVNQTVSSLKILFCDVLKRDWNKIDIPRSRIETKLPVVFSREEVSSIIHVTKNLKHRAVLMLTYSSGLRLHEVASLRIQDIDSHRMMVRIIQSKGNKDRYSILSPVALDMLRQYWKRYRPSVWLFEARSGKAMAVRSIQQMFMNALSKTGIKKEAGIHSLRHSFATHLMEQGVSLPIIQQLLGHKSLRTTSGYLHVQQYSVQSIKSPLDTLSL